MTYLITFVTYGARLHGAPSGSIDRHHNLPGSRYIGSDPQWLSRNIQRMNQPPYLLDAPRREVVIAALVDRCHQQHWTLLAAHARTTTSIW
jgi:hypothetical protein